MITRSKVVEQLRDYEIRSQRKCPALTIFSPKPFLTTWVDVMVALLWASLFSLLGMLSCVTLYFRHYGISFFFVCLGIFLPVRLRVSRKAFARKKKALLPLSF